MSAHGGQSIGSGAEAVDVGVQKSSQAPYPLSHLSLNVASQSTRVGLISSVGQDVCCSQRGLGWQIRGCSYWCAATNSRSDFLKL